MSYAFRTVAAYRGKREHAVFEEPGRATHIPTMEHITNCQLIVKFAGGNHCQYVQLVEGKSFFVRPRRGRACRVGVHSFVPIWGGRNLPPLIGTFRP